MSAPAEGSLGSGPAQGVIHDIGYRHYDGPRLGRGYVIRSLFGHSLRGAFGLGRSTKSKIMPAMLLVAMCLPALVIAAVVNGLHLTSLPLPYPRYPIALQAVVAIFVAAQAPQSVSRDLRFRLTSLYFSRPLLRRDYVLAKYAALVSALFVLLVTPLTILYGGALLAKLPAAAETRHYLLAVAGALVFALVLAGIGLIIAAFTPRRGIGVAAVITVLLVSYSAVSVVAGQGRTVLFSSHILEEVEQIAGRIEVVVAGRHAASGDFHEIRRLMTDRPHLYVLRSSDDRALAAALMSEGACDGVRLDPVGGVVHAQASDFPLFARLVPALARANEIRLYEVTPADESLESVFSYLVRS